MRTLSSKLVEQVINAAVRSGLTRRDRQSFLHRGIDRQIVAQLPLKETPADQLRSDVYFLTDPARLGMEPFGRWLANAFRLEPNEMVFAEALQALGRSVPPWPAAPLTERSESNSVVQDRVADGAIGVEVASGSRWPVHIQQREVSGSGAVGARFGSAPFQSARPVHIEIHVGQGGTGVAFEPASPSLDTLLVDGLGRLPDAEVPPSRLLIARNEVIPFTGRKGELADLDQWADTNTSVAVRLVHADGGVGKTRLAQEWVRRRHKLGRCAGFLPGALTDEVIAAVLVTDDADLVIDYAESRPNLSKLLHAMARHRQDDKSPRRLRVVLLARNDGDWWTYLTESSEELAELLDDSLVTLDLPKVKEPARFAEFNHALKAYAARFADTPALIGGQVFTDDVETPDLTDERFERALYLHAAALMAGLGEQVTAAGLLKRVLAHEKRIWLRGADFRVPASSAEAWGFAHAAHAVVAALTLLGGATHKRDLDALAHEFTNTAPMRLSLQLAQLYPAEPGTYAAPLEPDLLGETLVAQTLRSREHGLDWLDQVAAHASNRWQTVFTVLGRAETHDADVVRAAEVRLLDEELSYRVGPALGALRALGSRTAHAGLGRVLATALAARGNASIARRLAHRLPEHSVMLREVSAWTTQALVSEANEDAERAGHLANLGVRLSQLGRREEALEVTCEAVDIYRQLADKRPEAFLPSLTSSLINLGTDLSQLGRRDEALEVTCEAVDIYRRLAGERPGDFLPDLATSLNNLGVLLSRLGRREEALSSAREAVAIYRRLAGERPDTFPPNLAMSLHNLGTDLSRLGRREEALEVTCEAVDIYRRLAGERPDAFLPDLPDSLSNLGLLLGELGRREEALKVTREAVDIHRRLADGRPDAFLPDLATSLNNLGNRLSGLGRRKEALKVTREAVDIRRRLVDGRPDAFLPDLASSLNNLGLLLAGLGRREEALEVTREAVDIYRRLTGERPDVFLADFAGSLSNLGVRFSALGRREEALEVTREAVDIYRRLTDERPDVFLAGLATSLSNLGNRLSALHQQEEALQVTCEAVDIRRRLADELPDVFLADLAAALNNLGNRLSAMGRQEEALQATCEVVDIRRRLAEDRPDHFLADLAKALFSLANRLSTLARREEVLQVTREAVDIRRRLAKALPEVFLPDLAKAVSVHGDFLAGLDRASDARDAANEALDILWPFFVRLPDVHGRWIGMLLNDCQARSDELPSDSLAERLCSYAEWATTHPPP